MRVIPAAIAVAVGAGAAARPPRPLLRGPGLV